MKVAGSGHPGAFHVVTVDGEQPQPLLVHHGDPVGRAALPGEQQRPDVRPDAQHREFRERTRQRDGFEQAGSRAGEDGHRAPGPVTGARGQLVPHPVSGPRLHRPAAGRLGGRDELAGPALRMARSADGGTAR